MKRIVIVLAGLILMATVAQGAATILSPVVDGSVRDGIPPDVAKDGIADLALDLSTVEALNDPSMEERGIVEFDISQFSQGVQDASLTLPVFSSYGPYPFQIDAYSYSGDGLLTVDDWNLGSMFTSFSYSQQTSITLDVTNVLNSLSSGHANNAGFRFVYPVASTSPYNSPYLAFGSLEVPVPTPTPATLTVTPVPEPSILVLLVGGVMGWMLRRKRM